MRRRDFLKRAPITLAPAALLPPTLFAQQGAPPTPPTDPRAIEGHAGPWQPDGWAWQGQVALVMPHSDVEPDSEWIALAPDGVAVQAMRVRWIGVQEPTGSFTRTGGDAARAFVESPQMTEAIDMLVDTALVRPRAIGVCFTGSSYMLGPQGDLALQRRLAARAKGVPVTITGLAAVAAFRAVGARRLALVHPPWWPEDMDQRGADYFSAHGFEVVSHARAPLGTGRVNIHPGPLYEWIRANVLATADGVFIGGNGMRTIGAIQALETTLGKPVITSNQVTFWAALRLAKIHAPVMGYGQLFRHELPSS